MRSAPRNGRPPEWLQPKDRLHVIEELNAGREGWGLLPAAKRAVSEPTESRMSKESEDTKREAIGRTKRSTKESGDVRIHGLSRWTLVRNDAAPRDGVVVGVATGTTGPTAALTALAALCWPGIGTWSNPP